MADSDNARAERLVSDFATDPEMRELVEMFVTELPERIAAIENAVRQRHAVDLMRLAHQLKGAAAGYGFPAIGASAGTLENRLRHDNASLESLNAEVRALLDLCRRAAA